MVQQKPEENRRPSIEWVFGAISAVIVAGVIAFLIFEATFGDDQGPALAAQISKVEQVGLDTLVHVAIVNRGDKVASAVNVLAVASGADEKLQAKTIQFDYVAAKGSRRGVFIFNGTKLTRNEIKVEVSGFVEP
jgi:uncharacterized protein (TIGR02588 family)